VGKVKPVDERFSLLAMDAQEQRPASHAMGALRREGGRAATIASGGVDLALGSGSVAMTGATVRGYDRDSTG